MSSRWSRSTGRALTQARWILRRLLWQWHLALKSRVTIETSLGRFTFQVSQDDFLRRTLFCDRTFERELLEGTIELLRKTDRLPPAGGGTWIDVGANLGVTTVGALRLGGVGRAICIEPEPANFACLEENIALNGLEDRTIRMNLAVSGQAGAVELELSPENSGDHRVRMNCPVSRDEQHYQEASRHTVTVRTETLDDLIARCPPEWIADRCVLWMDVQGHEAQVLRGAGGLIARGVPILTEIWPYGLRRSGVDLNDFMHQLESCSSHYWMLRRGRMVRYPMSAIQSLFDELHYPSAHDNILLMD